MPLTTWIHPFVGELAALGSAFVWALGTVGFSWVAKWISPLQRYCLTTSGIAWVLLDRPDSAVDLSHLRAGICWAVVAALSHATGAVLSRTVYEQSTLTPLWATFFRFLVGQTALLIWLAVNRGKSLDLKPFRSLRFVSLSKSDPAQGRSL
jgi:drug/metabolite transporter (DMT)-like permease